MRGTLCSLVLRMVFVAAALVAGCADPEAVQEPGGLEAGHPCDYELDDYAGGQPRLMVHWDIEGERQMSGIEMGVTVFHDDQAAARGTTTTDCILFDMTGLDGDRVHVQETRDALCVWTGAASHDYGRDFETVKVPLEMACG